MLPRNLLGPQTQVPTLAGLGLLLQRFSEKAAFPHSVS